jgi:hypothetical protein
MSHLQDRNINREIDQRRQSFLVRLTMNVFGHLPVSSKGQSVSSLSTPLEEKMNISIEVGEIMIVKDTNMNKEITNTTPLFINKPGIVLKKIKPQKWLPLKKDKSGDHKGRSSFWCGNN